MSQNIAVLDPQVAAKIAAGEVIERPSAVVRELLDNAIDAGATQISLHIEEGGLQLIRVSDDGLGMSREDLELCYLAHATSKIRQTGDLLKLCSMGFRGEALGSIAACGKLRINSAQQQEDGKLSTYELRIADSVLQGIQATSAAHSGTQVEVRELFYSFPARRKFLKSTRSESASCKTIFQGKALAFPHIYFRLYSNGKMEQSLTPGSALERLCQIYGDLMPEQLVPLQQQTEHFSLQLFAAPPSFYRRDRKRMPIYINQRPIVENSLQQAVRLGYDGYLAGGLFPVCFSFLEVAPDRVDFNIHPAKREARLRDLNLIQAGIRQTLRSFCRESGKLNASQGQADEAQEMPFAAEKQGATYSTDKVQPEGRSGQAPGGFNYGTAGAGTRQRVPSHSYNPGSSSGRNYPSYSKQANHDGQEDISDQSFSTRELQNDHPRNSGKANFANQRQGGRGERWHIAQADWHSEHKFRYLGQLFEVFLLVEKPAEAAGGPAQLLIVDQHASHERILYETLESEMLQKQALLVPISFEVDPDEMPSLRQRSPALEAIGIQVAEGEDGMWQICSLPPSVSDLKEELIELVRHGASEAEDLKRELFAHLSCRKAIKKGDILDDISAVQLLEKLFSMGLERCPHGRPLWYSLDQQELYRLLQRT